MGRAAPEPAPAPNPNPFYAELPPYAQPKSQEMLDLEQHLEILRAEAEAIYDRRQDAIVNTDPDAFNALDERMRELPGLLARAENALIGMQLEWLESHKQPLALLSAAHIAAQDQLFAEKERLVEELRQRAEVMHEVGGRFDDLTRRMAAARRRRQDVLKEQMARVRSLHPTPQNVSYVG